MNKPEFTGTWFGQPGGLQTLFATEMWERMSYYGMRMMLVLFMTASLQDGGLAITAATAGAIYGLYTGAVYFMGVPGGWIADRLIGGQKSIWYGGIIILCGHIILAIPSDKTFFIGLIFVVLGTGLLKPNMSSLVGGLYADKDDRRDAGFAIYYMGINIGSLIGTIVCGALLESDTFGWHWAFGAAAVGMAFGLLYYRKTLHRLNGVGALPTQPLSDKGRQLSWMVIFGALVLLACITAMVYNGALVIQSKILADYVAKFFAVIFIIYFASIFFFGKLNQNEKKGMGALLLVCIASTCFFAGFEQAGTSLNLFARDYTDRIVDTIWWGYREIPTGWFQSLNSLFIIALSPFFAALWVNLSKKMISPSYSVKTALGLIIMATGFIVMFFAAQYAAAGLKVAPYWLVATYFLHTVGELCLSPVALSAVSKLSPKRFSGQLMGIFVLTYSMGSIISGILAGKFDPKNLELLPSLYIQISLFSIGIGIVLVLLSFKTKAWEKAAEAK